MVLSKPVTTLRNGSPSILPLVESEVSDILMHQMTAGAAGMLSVERYASAHPQARLLPSSCHRYPKIVKDVVEELCEDVNGVEIPINTALPNPNGIEFDNLYLVSSSHHLKIEVSPALHLEVLSTVVGYVSYIGWMFIPSV